LTVTADCLARAGHEVAIWAQELRGLDPRFDVRSYGATRGPKLLGHARFAFGAADAARRAGADVVVSFARAVGADILRSGGGAHRCYLDAARRWRGRLAATAMRLRPENRLQLLIERRAFTSARLKAVVAVSNLVRDDLIREFGLPPAAVVTIYNGVDLERFRPAHDSSERARIRESLGAPPDSRLVAFVGNGFGRKGLGFLLAAWPALGEAAHLAVAGTDRNTRRYVRRASALGVQRQIKFLGQREDVAEILRGADALALPSLFEPFGNVIVEAMASGLPVLASAQCGASELIPDEMRAFVVADPADSDELAGKLSALLEVGSGLARVAREAAERWTWARYAREFEGLIARVA
jgi:UDP-glucose:(heptosyl)LPS alpha-1,3-glucosyltransferase